MLNKEPGPERASVGFREAVPGNFKFLAEAGFRPTREQVTLVRYESPEIFVNIYHGRASFELGIEIGRLEEPDRKLSLYDIVAWAGKEKAEGFDRGVTFQVSSRKDVQEFVRKLALLVKKYAEPFLRGDHAAFDSAFEIQRERATFYELKVNMANIRSRADQAWHLKDYAQVVELYGPVRPHLSDLEAKKLSYAEQQLARSVGARATRRRK